MRFTFLLWLRSVLSLFRGFDSFRQGIQEFGDRVVKVSISRLLRWREEVGHSPRMRLVESSEE